MFPQNIAVASSAMMQPCFHQSGHDLACVTGGISHKKRETAATPLFAVVRHQNARTIF
jgi:hypothetical protein